MRAALPIVLVLVGIASAQETRLGEVKMHELLELMQLGVPSSRIIALLDRRGLGGTVTEEDLTTAERLGAAPDLMTRLTARKDVLVRLEGLAGRFGVERILGTSFRSLVPDGWTVAQRRLPAGLLLIARPEERTSSGWLAVPGVFVLVHEATPFPLEATPEIADRVAGVLSQRFRRSGIACRPRKVGAGMLSGQRVPEWSLGVEDERGLATGRIVFRARLWPDGALAVVGYAAAPDTEREAASYFDDMARHLERASPPRHPATHD